MYCQSLQRMDSGAWLRQWTDEHEGIGLMRDAGFTVKEIEDNGREMAIRQTLTNKAWGDSYHLYALLHAFPHVNSIWVSPLSLLISLSLVSTHTHAGVDSNNRWPSEDLLRVHAKTVKKRIAGTRSRSQDRHKHPVPPNG